MQGGAISAATYNTRHGGGGGGGSTKDDFGDGLITVVGIGVGVVIGLPLAVVAGVGYGAYLGGKAAYKGAHQLAEHVAQEHEVKSNENKRAKAITRASDNEKNNSALMNAVIEGDTKKVKSHLKDANNILKLTVLDAAIEANKPEIVHMILDKAQENAHKYTKGGKYISEARIEEAFEKASKIGNPQVLAVFQKDTNLGSSNIKKKGMDI